MAEIPLSTQIRSRLGAWVLETVNPVLLIVRLTIVYLFFLAADWLVLGAICYLYNDLNFPMPWGGDALDILRRVSVIAVAAGYVIHVLSQLRAQARDLT